MKKVLIFLTALFAIVAIPASAATFLVGEQVEQKENIFSDDIYVAGGSVDVTGNIGGDAILAGGEVSVLGRVSNDVNTAGGSVDVTGDVGDDLRVAGGQVSVSSNIGDDLVAAGGLVKILSGTRVSGDAVVAGGAVIMNGTVLGDFTTYAEDVTINGPINGDVKLKYSRKVTLGSDAKIAGDFTYSSTEELEIPEGVFIGGELVRTESPIKEIDTDNFKKVFGFLLFTKFVVMIVTAVVLVLVFKKLSVQIGEVAVKNFWKNALTGFVTLIITPIVGIILLTTVLGSYITFLLAFAYIFVLMVAKAYSGIVVGALLSKWTKKKVIVDWKWAILGVVVAQIATMVPLIGSLAVFAVCMAGFGTIGRIIHRNVWLNR